MGPREEVGSRVMRNVMLGFGLLVLGVVGAALWLDEGEVVTLYTTDADGHRFDTELWITDYAGHLYVRGAANRAWVQRLQKRPRVELEGAGRNGSYEARPIRDAAVTAAVKAAMEEKYGAAELLAETVFERREPLAIRLDPVDGAASADTQGPRG
jgi:hypothetical protein